MHNPEHKLNDISIHPPRGGRDISSTVSRETNIFQSTLPVGGGTRTNLKLYRVKKFQSTLPVGGGTIIKYYQDKTRLFQSTLPVGGGTCP